MLRCCLRGSVTATTSPSPMPKAPMGGRYENPELTGLTTPTIDHDDTLSRLSQETFFDAAENGDAETVRRYVEAGFDVNATDPEDGYTALLLAAECGSVEVVDSLCRAKAFLDARDSFGRTALYAACVASHTACVARLARAGADANCRDDDGRSPLWAACALRNVEVASTLLKLATVDLDARDHSGKSPLQHAVDSGHADVIEFLTNAGATDGSAGRLSMRASQRDPSSSA